MLTTTNYTKFLTVINGMKALATAITTSHGITDANKIVATNTAGVLDSSLLGDAGYAPVVVPYNPNLILDASSGRTFRVILGGNLTVLPPINPTDGQEISLEFTQDAIGSRTAVLSPTGFQFGSDFLVGSFVLSTGANVTDFLYLKYRASIGKWAVTRLVRGF